MNFSIVIPLYNKEDYVEETLQSVFDQTKLPSELIIVDDQSTDGSLQKARDFLDRLPSKFNDVRIEIIELEKNGGVGRARNIGFEKTTGDVISFLDADDIYAPDLLQTTDELMSLHDIDFLVVGIHLFPSNEISPDLRKLNQKLTTIIPDAYRMDEPLKVVTSMEFLMGVGSNLLVQRKWMESFMFYEKPNFYEGIDYWFRVLKHILKHKSGSIGLLMGERLKVREVPGSASRKRFDHWKEAHYPPLLISFKGSRDTYDKLMMGVVGKRWLRYCIRNLNSTQQKLIFIYKYKYLFWNQFRYFLLRNFLQLKS